MKFWERETPVTATTQRNTLSYYKEADRLAVSIPAWTDSEGNERRGKTVALDLRFVRESPAAVQIIREIAATLG